MDSTYLKDPIVWIDLEMTGLDLKKDKIIEIAVVITNGHLTKKINGPNLIIKCENNLIGKIIIHKIIWTNGVRKHIKLQD